MTEKKIPEGIHPSASHQEEAQEGVERQQVAETRESRLSDEQLLAQLSDMLYYLVDLAYDAKTREEHFKGTYRSELSMKILHRQDSDKITAEILKRLKKAREEK